MTPKQSRPVRTKRRPGKTAGLNRIAVQNIKHPGKSRTVDSGEVPCHAARTAQRAAVESARRHPGGGGSCGAAAPAGHAVSRRRERGLVVQDGAARSRGEARDRPRADEPIAHPPALTPGTGIQLLTPLVATPAPRSGHHR